MELKINDVSKNYRTTEALSHFDASLSEGIYALLGPNGSGKSTLMNIVAGVLKPSSGNVTYDGNEISALGTAYYKIFGFLPQTCGFYKNFTAREFLEYMAALKGMDDRKRAKQRIEEVLELVHLSDAADKRIGGFSGGMRQRVGIAQSLLGDPKILVLDEPTAGLDPQERISFKNYIAKIAFDKIIILATHIVSDVESIAKEILLIKNGRKILHDTVDNCIKSVEGHVFLLETTEDKASDLTSLYKVAGISSHGGKVTLKIIADEAPEGALPAEPDMEDLYMYHFA